MLIVVETRDEILRLILELDAESESIAGTIASGNGRGRPFDGMLDLMSAIEGLRKARISSGSQELMDTNGEAG